MHPNSDNFHLLRFSRGRLAHFRSRRFPYTTVLAAFALSACTTLPKPSPVPEQKASASASASPASEVAQSNIDTKFVTRSKVLSNLARSKQNCAAIDSKKVYRFVEGANDCMVELDASFSASQLQDPFAQTVLHQNARPDSVDKIVAAMSSAKLQQSSFIIGEGSQVPLTTAPRDADRSLRYVISWVTANNGPGVFLSAAPGGHSSFLQVVAWDAVNGVFNFYEYRAQLGSSTPKAWSR